MRMLRTAISALTAVNTGVGHAGRAGAGLFLFVMVVIVMMQIVSRYVLNDSLSWTEEASKTLMVWTAFLVAPWAYRSGAYVAIDFFVEAMPRRFAHALHTALNALVLWIVAVFFFESLDFVAKGMQSKSASLPVQTGYFYLIIPISMFCLFVSGCEVLLRHMLGIFDPDAPESAFHHTYPAE